MCGGRVASKPTKVLPIVRLWCCHQCKYIGAELEARAHFIVRGHKIEELDQQTTDAIFAEWRRTGDPRAVA